MHATRYDYEVVSGFWRTAKDVSEQLQKTVETNRLRWEATNAVCQGIAAIPSIVQYLTNATNVCADIVEAVETGTKLNEEYAAAMEEAARDIDLES